MLIIDPDPHIYEDDGEFPMKDTGMTFLIRSFFLMVAAAVALAACSGTSVEKKYPTGENRQASDNPYEKPQSVFGAGGLALFGKGKSGDGESGGGGIGVNSFLWRASLDTISFMPIASADPFGGTILTDWYSPQGQSDERYKLNVFILDRQLRSDGIQVKAFKQVFARGGWHDAPVPVTMSRQLEDTILTRARQLRVAQAGGR